MKGALVFYFVFYISLVGFFPAMDIPMKINKKDKKEISKEYKDIDEESEKESKSDEESEKEAFTFSFRSEWMLGLFFNKLLCKTNKTDHKNLTSQYVEIVSPPPEI